MSQGDPLPTETAERWRDPEDPVEPAPTSPASRRMPRLVRDAHGEALDERDLARLAPGGTLGRYVVLGKLGSGGMGTVLKAYDESLDRAIALKLLHPGAAARHARRLTREAQALAKLSHPNVVHVYEVGRADGQWFIAMELATGRTLRQWQREVHPWRQRVEVYLQAGEGLAAAHAAGLVHRDFKPDNCIIDEHGRARVLDFGLVRETDVPSEDGDRQPSDTLETEARPEGPAPLTHAGTVLGTLVYMPLEQLEGRPVDARSDQFSFCVSLYEALYGERPYRGNAAGPLTVSLTKGEIRPAPRGSRVPSSLRRVLRRGLSSDPDERWPSMRALLDELRHVATPRRRRGMPVMIVGGLMTLGLALWQRAPAAQPCQGARDRLSGVWDDERRDAVRRAIEATNLSYARQTWERVEPRLTEYAEAWIDEHQEVCEATSVRREQSSEVMDLRMACLERRRVELREVVDVLAEANETRVVRAVGLVSNLRGLSGCGDIEALRSALPPPEDPEVAERVASERERLASALSLDNAGEYALALEEAVAAAAAAETLDHPPLTVEALWYRGRLRARTGQYDEAEEDLERAFHLAVEHGHAEIEASAARTLAFMLGDRKSEYERAMWWAEIALSKSKGKHGAPEDVGTVLLDMGSILQRQRKLEQALDHSKRGLAIVERTLGAEHITLGQGLNNIGNILRTQGEPDEALSYFRRALDILEHQLGPNHPLVGSAVDNIGLALKHQGDFEGALDHHRRALAIFETGLGPRHTNVAYAAMNLGHLLWAQERCEESIEYSRRARSILEEQLGSRHAYVAAAVDNIAMAQFGLGQLEPARVNHEQALSIFEEALGPEHPDLAYALTGLAAIALRTGEADTARRHAARAVALREAGEVAPHLLAKSRFVLAQASWDEPAEREAARELVRRARQTFVELGIGHEGDLADVERWLEDHPVSPSP